MKRFARLILAILRDWPTERHNATSPPSHTASAPMAPLQRRTPARSKAPLVLLILPRLFL